MFSKIYKNLFLISGFLILIFAFGVSAQNKRNSRPAESETKQTESQQKAPKFDKKEAIFSYEFTQPKFTVSHIVIKHDKGGNAQIVYLRKDFEDELTESVKLSDETIEKLNGYWSELDFLNSTEEYQSAERDYSHLGILKLKMQKDEKEREVEFNWTENQAAKSLAEEYRKIGNQFLWMFEINVSRQNQPLESPRLMKKLDTYLRLNGIADPQQMVPFLKELSDDERMPLIARNHATRIMKKINKQENKEVKKDQTSKKQ